VIGAILWKEWRDQRTVAGAVLVFGALALFLAAEFTDPVAGGVGLEGSGPRELLAVALAYLAGAVSGAIILADEKEVGTLEFLDGLPCPRRTVWVAKVFAGAVLAMGQCTVLALLAYGLGSIDQRIGPGTYTAMVVFTGLLAFAWGTFGGALAKSTLGAVFQGSMTSFVVGVVLAVPFLVVAGQRGMSRAFGAPLLAFFMCWVGTGLAGSAVFFTAVDRRRRVRRAGSAAAAGTSPKPWLAGMRALGWLSTRQAAFVAVGAGAAGLLFGAVLLAPDAMPLFVWPGATLGIGVLAGVTALGEEQVRGVARYWAERRLPLGRMWAVKTLVHFGIAALAAAILLAMIFAGSPFPPFRSRLLAELRPEVWRFLGLGLVYGFVVGHLAGMLFRKTVVAGLVASVTAATLVGLILPSVVGGGAANWQVWGPAATLLVVDRLLLYPWATDRVTAHGPLARAIGGIGLAILLLGAGIVFRVAEIPVEPDRLAQSGFLESLPAFEANDVGREVKAAVSQYRQTAVDNQSWYPGGRGPAIARRANIAGDVNDPLARSVRTGWTTETEPLGPWLDRVFAGEWVKILDGLSDKPAGVYEDPRDVDYTTPPDAFLNLREMTYAVRARGLQRQATGDPAAYPRLLRGALVAVRTGRNRGGLQAAHTALDGEDALLGGLSEWLDRLHGRADLLRPVLADLIRHEAGMPTGTDDAFWAEQVLLRNTLDRVGSWLPRYLDPRAAVDSASPRAEAEANLVAFAWNIPWERARRERLLRVQSNEPADRYWLSPLHLPNRWRGGHELVAGLGPIDVRALTSRRFACLVVALRLFQAEHGVPAADLAALVPEYLPALPADPYTGQSFGYRLSAGELITAGGSGSHETLISAGVVASLANPVGGLNGLWTVFRSQIRVRPFGIGPPGGPLYQVVPPGFGILWSAGPDGRDDGGHRNAGRGANTAPGQDWIIVVPAGRPAR
jgi:hypothetical protein